MALPDPELMSLAQNVTVYSQAVAQSASQLINSADKTTPEHSQMQAYLKDNIQKFKVVLDELEARVAN
jgi:hypothetical protein